MRHVPPWHTYLVYSFCQQEKSVIVIIDKVVYTHSVNGSTTILLIEDNETMRLLYKHQLVADGYSLLDAANARDGFKILQNEKIDLLLLDILLPDKNGLDLLAEIRQDIKFANLPVLLLTTLPEEVAFDKGKALNIYGYIVKDQITPEILSQRVKLTLSEISETKTN